MGSLVIWYKSAGSISVETIVSPKVEMFYWSTILFSQTLGTALGDWMADTNGLGYEGGPSYSVQGWHWSQPPISLRAFRALSSSGPLLS
jgi:hypothetical protein